MNRRSFLKQISLLFLFPYLPQAQAYTYGAWLLPVATDCDPRCISPCLEFTIQTGTKAERDAFFAGIQGFQSRGWYGFSYPRLLNESEITALRELFEEKCDTRFPIVQREG